MSAQGADGDAGVTQSPPLATASAGIVDGNAGEASAGAVAGPSTPQPANGIAHSSTGKVNKHVPSASTSDLPSRRAGSATPPPPATSLGRSSTPSREIGRTKAPSGAPPAEQRRNNPRGNRLSSFFSNLRPRPQTMPPTPIVPPRPPPVTKPKETIPDPVPPSLAAPTLRDLGLSLNVLTPPLYPSHFATPPTSGTFMQPHFLLLCHSQGLDVLPLVGPPAPLAYALVRRVAFKSVVVMEERGVLVAIAGRRDGVRVYALEEVRKAIEWRIEVEVQREAEKLRREEIRNRPQPSSAPPSRIRNMQPRPPTTAKAVPKRAQPPATPAPNRTPPPNYSSLPVPTISVTRQPMTNRAAALTEPSGPPRDRGVSVSSMVTRRMLVGNGNFDGVQEEKPEWLDGLGGEDEEALVAAGPSGSAALEARTSSMPATSQPMVPNATGDMPDAMEEVDMSDGEGENNHRDSTDTVPSLMPASAQHNRSTSFSTSRPARPASLHLRPPTTGPPSASINGDATPPASPGSPAPTVFSLQRSLSRTPNTPPPPGQRQNERITFAEALMESRLPTARPSNLTGLRTASHTVYDPNADHDNVDDEPSNSARPPPASAPPPLPPLDSRRPSNATLNSTTEQRSRRRWSFVSGSNGSSSPHAASRNTTAAQYASRNALGASPSLADCGTHRTTPVQRTSPEGPAIVHRSPSMPGTPNSRFGAGDRLSRVTSNPAPPSHASSSAVNAPSSRTPSAPRRFLPKLLGAFRSSNHDRQRKNDATSDSDTDRPSTTSVQGVALGQPLQIPPPKMEYVKLPGTQKTLMIKAVETAKKSFLAILCGENGEKVELFAGTYRTALGLSRTFILPDSPRSLELQLQGDDLVELFLMFNQNVFGLEPATVRVREVRIGRAERRARRRAAQRENELLGGEGTGEGREGMTLDNDQNTQVITTVMTVGDDTENPNGNASSTGPPAQTAQRPSRRRRQSASEMEAPRAGSAGSSPSVATSPLAGRSSLPRQKSPDDKAQSLPYTTFQQLSFAPNFPLAAIADEYAIPPTYLDFIDYQKHHEASLDISEIPTTGEPADASQTADTPAAPRAPPGLPRPPPRWIYRDPKGILRGPWDAEVMQNWLRDGYLPPTLPLRRENETDFITLKELMEAHPNAESIFFVQVSSPSSTSSSRPASPNPAPSTRSGSSPWIPVPNVLLPPTSLLQQPRYFGPPALFFTTRGGHSTAIVDARGRSVLKGRVMWSHDGLAESESSRQVLGDVKRIEAFDTRDQRAVVVALRQGGLEAVDMGDALLQPGDHSRSVLPLFMSPAVSTGRRKNYIWHLGSAVEDISAQSTFFGVGAQRTTLGRKAAPPQRRTNARRDHLKDPGDNAPLSPDEDILFLGRTHDRVYMCERTADSFRILRLAPIE